MALLGYDHLHDAHGVCQCRLASSVRDPGRGDRSLRAGLRAGEAVRPTGHRHRSRRGALAVIENLPVYEAGVLRLAGRPARTAWGHLSEDQPPDMAKIGQLMLDDGVGRRADRLDAMGDRVDPSAGRHQRRVNRRLRVPVVGHDRQRSSTLLRLSGSAVSSSRSSPTFASSWWFPARSPRFPPHHLPHPLVIN